jgi:hypothetical protein
MQEVEGEELLCFAMHTRWYVLGVVGPMDTGCSFVLNLPALEEWVFQVIQQLLYS